MREVEKVGVVVDIFAHLIRRKVPKRSSGVALSVVDVSPIVRGIFDRSEREDFGDFP